MPLVGLLAALAIAQAPQEGALIRQVKIKRPGEEIEGAMLQVREDPLSPPRFSPKKFGQNRQPWEFDFLITGFGYIPEVKRYQLRFRVYSQERKRQNDRATMASRMLMTLWDDVHRRVNLDHAEHFNGRIVDVFMCWGGKAGGEQLYDVAVEDGKSRNVNTIYFYDMNSFTDPVEMAREVAHEYGHAVLPAIGGYSAPEDWANGYLGEKLFMRWMRDDMASGRIAPQDVMGASREQLDKWVATNVDSLVSKAASAAPKKALFTDMTAAGMDRYMGLALYASTILPDKVFGRSLLLTGSTEAKDYPEAIALAAEEPDEYTITIPPLLADKPIWIPLGKAKLSGGKLLKYDGAWAQVTAPAGTLTVTNRK